MYCWNCGTRNPDEFTFCGKCGKRMAITTLHDMSSTASGPRQSVADAAPMPSNPLVEESHAVRESFKEPETGANRVVEEPRVAHDSARNMAKIEPPTAISVEDPPARVEPTESRTLEKQRLADVREFKNPHALPPNRITGPSFLGLSDESSETSESSYLLDDDQPQRSHWRAWVALAVLALLGFLIYKQWRAVKAGAAEVTQRAAAFSSGNTSQSKPEGNVSGDGAASTAASQPPTDGALRSSSDLDKPEDDKTAPESSTSKDETAASSSKDTTSAAASKANDQSDLSDAKAKEPEEASTEEAMDDAADTKTEEKDSAKTAKKSQPAPDREPQFDNASVDQADRYLRGQGVPQNCSRAISLLRSAAREGNPRAQVKLGALYATGHCVTQDRAAAYQWLARAQETQPNNSYLQRTMNNLWANMTPEERDRITR